MVHEAIDPLTSLRKSTNAAAPDFMQMSCFVALARLALMELCSLGIVYLSTAMILYPISFPIWIPL